jgi:hypothetical protein
MIQPQLTPTTEQATAIHVARKVRQAATASTSSVAWVDVPGATASFFVPPNHKDVWYARFTSGSLCTGGNGACVVRILLNGVEMGSGPGEGPTLDRTGSDSEPLPSYVAREVDCSATFAAGAEGGLVTLQVQYAVSASGITFRLDGWQLAVEAHH